MERMGEVIILMSGVKAQSRSGSLPEARTGFPGKNSHAEFFRTHQLCSASEIIY